MITREELYSLVWSMSVDQAARRLGVSNIYLARVCVALDVPRPPRGWWRKVETGNATKAPALPPKKLGFPDRWDKDEATSPPLQYFYRLSRKASAISDHRHPLVRLASDIYNGAEAGADGVHLVSRRSDADLTCSRTTLRQSLNLADALFMGLEARGHPVRIEARQGFIRPILENWIAPPCYTTRTPPTLWKPKRPTIAIIEGVPIGVAIMEISEEVLMRYVGHGEFARASTIKKVAGITWTEWQRVPNGRLKFIAYSPHFPSPWQREWVERRKKALARTAETIISELESLAPTLPHAGFFREGR